MEPLVESKVQSGLAPKQGWSGHTTGPFHSLSLNLKELYDFDLIFFSILGYSVASEGGGASVHWGVFVG